jgi:hypothetical protein
MSPPGIYVGVDPGTKGALAIIVPDSDIVLLQEMPGTRAGILKWSLALGRVGEEYLVYVLMEQVTGYVPRKEERNGQGDTGSSQFKFGKNCGWIEMAFLASLHIEVEQVHPKVWQSKLNIPKRMPGEKKYAWKSRLRDEAQKRFPDTRITVSTADALLIAEYCRQKHEG